MKIFTTAFAVLTTVLLCQACTKTSYRSYKCECTQSSDGFTTEYGLQAEKKGDAVADCYDIQQRVNNADSPEGQDDKVSCGLK